VQGGRSRPDCEGIIGEDQLRELRLKPAHGATRHQVAGVQYSDYRSDLVVIEPDAGYRDLLRGVSTRCQRTSVFCQFAGPGTGPNSELQ
jgi:hypothetical protein